MVLVPKWFQYQKNLLIWFTLISQQPRLTPSYAERKQVRGNPRHLWGEFAVKQKANAQAVLLLQESSTNAFLSCRTQVPEGRFWSQSWTLPHPWPIFNQPFLGHNQITSQCPPVTGGMASTEYSSYILLFPVLRTCVCMSSVPWKGKSRAAFHCPSQIQMQPFRDATSTSKASHRAFSSGPWWNQWVSWLGEVLWRGDTNRVQTAAKTWSFCMHGQSLTSWGCSLGSLTK